MAFLLCAASDSTLNRKNYQIPDGTKEFATVHFPKGSLNLTIYGSSDAQYYGVIHGSTCRDTSKLVIYNATMFGVDKETNIKIPAGSPINIISSTLKHISYSSGLRSINQWSTCTKIISFTPIPGRSYSIMQEPGLTKLNYCSVDVKDESTNSRPADLSNEQPISCIF